MIRVGKLPDRFGEGDKKHPTLNDFENINVTSASRGIYSKLSPMKLGPFVVTERIIDEVELGYIDNGDGYQSANINIFENYWQGSKIYKEDFIEGTRTLKQSFFERRARMYTDNKPHRRSLPKSHGLPVAGYYHGQIYDYVPSRQFYVRYYTELVQKTQEYQSLVDKFNKGNKLHIIGYDGRDIGPITRESITLAYNDHANIFGHELLLAALITKSI